MAGTAPPPLPPPCPSLGGAQRWREPEPRASFCGYQLRGCHALPPARAAWGPLYLTYPSPALSPHPDLSLSPSAPPLSALSFTLPLFPSMFFIIFPIVLSLTGFFPPLLYRFPSSPSPSLFSCSFSLSPVYFLSPLPSQEGSQAGPWQWGRASWGRRPHEAGSLDCQHRRVSRSYFRLSCEIQLRRCHRCLLHLGREPEPGPG